VSHRNGNTNTKAFYKKWRKDRVRNKIAKASRRKNHK
jgi:hypothetical protein